MGLKAATAVLKRFSRRRTSWIRLKPLRFTMTIKRLKIKKLNDCRLIRYKIVLLRLLKLFAHHTIDRIKLVIICKQRFRCDFNQYEIKERKYLYRCCKTQKENAQLSRARNFFQERKLIMFKKMISMILTVIMAVSTLSLFTYADDYFHIFSENCNNGDVLITDSAAIQEALTKMISAQMSISDLFKVYPNNSHYTKNGKKCVCHNSANCPENCNCMAYYAYDDAGNMSVCYQCAAFAKLCYKTFNGKDVPYLPDAHYPGFTQLSTNNLYSYLQKIGTNAYVRRKTATGAVHSVFIISYTRDSVTIYHANYDNECGVLNETVSYGEFLRRINQVRFYYTSGGTVGV